MRPDAELQMDVAHEVRAHIEDAAEEARERGLEMTGFKPYQDHLRELNQEWLDAHRDSGQLPR